MENAVIELQEAITALVEQERKKHGYCAKTVLDALRQAYDIQRGLAALIPELVLHHAAVAAQQEIEKK